MKFFDNAKIYVQAGNGGNGASSFRREKFIPFGGPDGGNGGDGGNVILKVDLSLNNLIYFHYQVHHKAKNGKNGSGSNCTGHRGENLIIKVPLGTQIIDPNNDNIIFDLNKQDQEFVIANGGRGGLGNIMFKTSTNRTPFKRTLGENGESGWFILRLKLISDVGLLGMPNAGKSSFISIVTNAKSKIGDYTFTTLKPILGVMQKYKQNIVICDIPGLIEGASNGVGLGDKFLQHVERCSTLLHILDISEEKVMSNYMTIRKEIIKYNDTLNNKNEIIILNKIDLISKKEVQKILKSFQKFKKPIFAISTITKEGIEELVDFLFKNIKHKAIE